MSLFGDETDKPGHWAEQVFVILEQYGIPIPELKGIGVYGGGGHWGSSISRIEFQDLLARVEP